MNINQINLVNFRNYKHESFQFYPGINLISGLNAQGKTNLLESIYYLSTTRSHRITDDFNLIKKEENFFKIDAIISKKNRLIDMSCIVSKNGKNLFLYRNPVKKVSQFVGFFNAVLFSPDDMNLFTASPKVRRRFMDLELGKCSKTYLKTCSDYEKCLRNRNSHLKLDKIDETYLNVLNDQMASLQVIIIKQRLRFMQDLIELSNDFYHELSDDQSVLSFKYNSFVNPDDENLKQTILDIYNDNLDRDRMVHTTEKGVHRDDFVLLMNGEPASHVASQGQKRTILLALKIGLVRMIEKIIQDEPVLLLDDVFSELDDKRKKALLKLLPKNIQIFITSADRVKINSDRHVHVIEIENGRIKGGM